MREADVIERLRRIAPRRQRAACSTMWRCSTAWSSPTTGSPRAFISCPTTRRRASAGSWSRSISPTSPPRARRPAGALLSLTIAGDGRMGKAIPRRRRSGLRELRPAADRRRHDRSAAGAPRVLGLTAIGRAGEPVPDRGRRRAGRPPLAHRNASAMRPPGWRSCARTERDRPAGRHLPPARAAARAPGRRSRPQAQRDDGRLRRPAARCAAHGRGKRLRGRDRARSPAAVRALSSPSAARISTRACSRRPAATIMRCSPRFPPELDPSTLSLPNGTTIARIGTLAAGEASGSLTSGGGRSNCRRGWALSIRT